MEKKHSFVPDTATVIAHIIVCALIAIVFVMIFYPPKADQAILAIINMLLGALVAKFGTVVDFFFGSNKASQAKDETIAAIASAPSTPPVPPTTDAIGEAMLTNGERDYFRKLTTEDAKKAFLNMSTAERQATIAKGG